MRPVEGATIPRTSSGGSVRYNPTPKLTLGGLGSGFTLDRTPPIYRTLSGLGYGQSRPRRPAGQPVGYTSPWVIHAPQAGQPARQVVNLSPELSNIPVQYQAYQPTGYDTVEQPEGEQEQLFGSPVIYYDSGGLGRGGRADAARSQGLADRHAYRSAFGLPYGGDRWLGMYRDWLNKIEELQPEPDPPPVYYGGGYGGWGGGWGGWGSGGRKSPFDFLFNRLNWRI